MPYATLSPSGDESTELDQARADQETELADLDERLTETHRTISEKRARAERLRVQIERTKVGYREGIPPHLLKGTQPDEIRQYAIKLKQWKG